MAWRGVASHGVVCHHNGGGENKSTPGELVEAVPDGHVDRFSEDTVPMSRVRDHLRTYGRCTKKKKSDKRHRQKKVKQIIHRKSPEDTRRF